MVHTVHNSIYLWAYIGRALADISHYIKKSFPEFTHTEGSMGCVTVLEKSLRKDRQVPMAQKEHKDY
jgi:hypothetical protein